MADGYLEGETRTVQIDFVEPSIAESLADEAKRLYDQEIPIRKIARILQRPYRAVRNAIYHWFESRGLPHENGRSRRSHIKQKHVVPPLYQRISDDVKRLADQGMLFQRIARELKVDRNTVTQAWRYWHSSRGLTPEMGHQRRGTMHIKNENPRRRRSDQEQRPAA